jgi:hypothetical protein
MKSYFNLAYVLGIFALQSCYSSSGNQLVNPVASMTEQQQDSTIKARQLTIVSEYNGITIDTTYDETTFFVSRVDDEKGLAYGSFYQFDNASTTELSAVVPYSCMKYDTLSKNHMLIVHEFRKALATDSLSHMFVQNRTLSGHKYRNVDARM